MGASTLDPYFHGYIGMQIATPLFISIRQSAEISNILEEANRLYPGVDLKLRLLKEHELTPELSIGLQSAFGHRRQAGEFIALSKRYNNFDFTGGIGWGRFGTAGHIKNPLNFLGSHFNQNRDINGESTNEPSDWFSGKEAGFFGGMEYFLPVKGLSLKLDYGADRYSTEQSATDYDPPSPWGLGLAYNYNDTLSAQVGMQGTDKLMARLSLKARPEHLKPATPLYYNYKKTTVTDNLSIPLRAIPDKPDPQDLGIDSIRIEGQILFITLNIPENISSPYHINEALRYVTTEYADYIQDIKELAITLKRLELEGTTIRILRKDIEKSISIDNEIISPQEIWQNAEFTAEPSQIKPQAKFLPTKGLKLRSTNTLILDTQISLSEEDTGALYRTSALISARDIPVRIPLFGDRRVMNGIGFRVNLADNLDRLNELRPRALLPVRSDIADFTGSAFGLEHSYFGIANSFTPELHFSLLSGYLEEFYYGTGSELLYRPFNARLALGAELWHAQRRDPDTPLALGLNGTGVLTGHANIWYDIPMHDVTANLRIGRFLAGDAGFAFGLEKDFKNGAKIAADIAISNHADTDPFGENLSAQHSLSLIIPLGAAPVLNAAIQSNTRIAPFGRNAAQILNKPVSLYEISEPFTLDHIAAHWDEIAEK